MYKQNKIDKIECLSKVKLLNQNINDSFNLLQNTIRTNLYYLYKFILEYKMSLYYENIYFCIINNKNLLDLLNNLLFEFLCIVNILIGIIAQ